MSILIGAETLNIMTLVKMTFSITLKRSVEFRNLVHYAYCRFVNQGTLTLVEGSVHMTSSLRKFFYKKEI